MKSLDPLKVQAFEVLFPYTFNLIDSVTTVPAPPDKLFFARGIPTRIIRQVCSVCRLEEPIPIPNGSGQTVTDPISVSVIARAVLESYLVWENIFISSTTEEEKEFWYFAWALKSFKLHTAQKPPLPNALTIQTDPKTGKPKQMKAIDVYNNMLERVDELQNSLKNNAHYKSIMYLPNKKDKSHYEEYAKNGWKVSPPFLLEKSMKYFHSRKIYDYLSATSHLDYIDVKQILLAKTHEEIKTIAEASLTVILVVLARLCEQYPLVFPEAGQKMKPDNTIQEWIEAYREITDKE